MEACSVLDRGGLHGHTYIGLYRGAQGLCEDLCIPMALEITMLPSFSLFLLLQNNTVNVYNVTYYTHCQWCSQKLLKAGSNLEVEYLRNTLNSFQTKTAFTNVPLGIFIKMNCVHLFKMLFMQLVNTIVLAINETITFGVNTNFNLISNTLPFFRMHTWTSFVVLWVWSYHYNYEFGQHHSSGRSSADCSASLLSSFIFTEIFLV